MMKKWLSILAILALMHCIMTFQIRRPRYSLRYDNVDIDLVLGNRGLFRRYLNCLLDKGPCTKDGRDIKRFLPEVLSTSCAKCTNKQAKNIRKLITAVKVKYPQEWTQLLEMADPDSLYRNSLDKFLHKPE